MHGGSGAAEMTHAHHGGATAAGPPSPGSRVVAFLTVDGLTCPSCAEVVARTVAQHKGVRSSDINFAMGKARVEYDPALTGTDEIVHLVERAGYRARVVGVEGGRGEDKGEERTLIQLLVAVAFGMQVDVFYLVQLYGLYATGQAASPQARTIGMFMWAAATPVLFYGGQSFLRGAWQGLKARTANMDTLVALGTLSAYTYSIFAVLTGRPAYFDSVTMITVFIMIGRYIETVGGAQARKDVRALLELQPDRAWRVGADGALVQVRAAELAAGDTIVVKFGERIPADATVTEGTGAADEALLTGESSPAPKRAGDALYAGTVLREGPLTAKVERPVDASRLASIRALVEHTLAGQAPVQRLADTASAYLTFGVLGIAVLTFLGWWLVAGAAPATALIAAVAVLVVACPCALGLATPLAISVSTGRATRAGVLVRVPAALETAALVSEVAIDKTGTLTAGNLQVTGTGVVEGVDRETLLSAAAAVEQYSEHPLGRAIARSLPTVPTASGVRSVRGLGVEGALEDGRTVRVGSEAFMPRAPSEALAAEATAHADAAESIVWVSLDGRVTGFIALRDDELPGASKAVDELRAMGRTILLLSGDSEATTAAVAGKLGITEHRSRLTPESKAEVIAERRDAGANVAMVGDGVNDAPALAQADLSVTVWGGSDVAGETSDVVLARPDLDLLPWFLRMSAATRRITRQNLGWAFAYNAIAIPLAAFGVISPAVAAATMAGSSVLVVGNSLRLRRMARR
jgi:heavy metal translocating P-type ATPase